MNAPVVTRLNVNEDSKAKCAQYDVYFDGVKQQHCLIADSERGYIERYKMYMGMIVQRNGKPVLMRLNGRVQIVPKGEVPQ